MLQQLIQLALELLAGSVFDQTGKFLLENTLYIDTMAKAQGNIFITTPPHPFNVGLHLFISSIFHNDMALMWHFSILS